MVFYVILLGAVLVLSSIFLLRRRSSTSTPATTPSGLAEPPRVPAWLPFVGNALDFGRNSQGFLQQCQAAYGDAFRLKMMGQDYVFVLDPFSFPNVFREEKKNLSFIAIVREFACKCFGASEAEFEKQNHETVHKQFITYLQGMELPALTARMREHLERAVKEKTQPQLQAAGDAQTWQDGRMWQFVMEVLYVAGTRAFFGDTFDVEQSFKDFFAFDENFPAFTVGVPHFLLGKSVKARQRMNDLLVHLTDPTASKLMVERERYLVEETSIPPHQLSRLQFATFWAAHGNTLPAAFWSLAYILSDKRAKQEITEEVFSLFNKKDTGRETFAKLKDMVKLESAINEALRMSSASIIVREVINDFTLKLQNGNQFHVKSGQKVAMYPYIIHNNPEVYDNPHLYQFDRFLAEENDEFDYSNLKFTSPAKKALGTLERVESADVLHLKQRELRQLRESRRLERDVRDSRIVYTTSTTLSDAGLEDSALPVPTNTPRDAFPDLKESREQTTRELRESGRLFARILRESSGGAGQATSEGETDTSSPESKRTRSPEKPAITLSEKLRQKEKEEEEAAKAVKTKGLEQEQEHGEHSEQSGHDQTSPTPTTPTSKRSLDKRFPSPSTLQEQLSSSGEVDLASPLFLRRAQRMRRRFDSDSDHDDDEAGDSDRSPALNKNRKDDGAAYSPPPQIHINDEPDFAASDAFEAEAEAQADIPVPPFKLGSGLKRSKKMLQILAAANRRDRSVSLGVIPQQPIDTAVAAVNAQADANAQQTTDQPPAEAAQQTADQSQPFGADGLLRIPPMALDALGFQPTSAAASAAFGDASPRISREQHLMFKKRERTGSFNIPSDSRPLRKEKKFYYKGRELRYHLMPFGGGAGMCPGRYFARNELKLFVAVMIYYFDLELIPDEHGEIKLPSLDETRLGIGILPPAKDLPFRFRLRDEHLSDFAAPQQQQQPPQQQQTAPSP